MLCLHRHSLHGLHASCTGNVHTSRTFRMKFLEEIRNLERAKNDMTVEQASWLKDEERPGVYGVDRLPDSPEGIKSYFKP